MTKPKELKTVKMEGETAQQYTAWLLYCETGSIRKLLNQWESVWRGFGKSSAELEGIREKLGKPPTRRTLDNWSKQYQWVKRTDLKLAEDLEAMREKSKKIARDKKHKILEALERIANKILKQLKEGAEPSISEWKQVWEMAQVELGKPTSRTQLIEQSPLTPEEKKEGKELDEKLKQFIRNQIGQEREGERPILDTKEQNKKRKRKKD